MLLNDSVYKFKKYRIFSKLKSGGAIPKYFGGSVINGVEANNQLILLTFVLPIVDYVKLISSNADSRIAAKRKLNRKVKAPMKPADDQVLKLLDKLWRAGAFKGVKNRRGRELTYEQAVDGISGSLTRQAIANYNKSLLNSSSMNNSLSTVNNSQSSILEDALRLSVRKVGELQERFSRFTDENKLKNNLKSLYKLNNVVNPFISTPLMSAYNRSLFTAYSNAYPYSYGDVVTNGVDTIPYSAEKFPNGIPDNYRLVQTTADTPKEIQIESMRNKFIDATKREDPRLEFMKKLAAIDLSTPEGKNLYLEMMRNKPQGFIRGGGNPENALFEMRARLDAANAYTHQGQLLYDTFEYNTDFDSPTAKSLGRATYRIKDPKLRERIYGEMVNYFLKHKKEGHWKDDDPNSGIYILPHMGYMGNLSMIADDENGLNLRYGDWWDYLVNPNDAYVMYMGDRLVPEGTYPKWYGNRQVGHNTKEMTEAFDGNYVKELSKSLLGLRKGGNLSYNPVKKFKLCFINLKN